MFKIDSNLEIMFYSFKNNQGAYYEVLTLMVQTLSNTILYITKSYWLQLTNLTQIELWSTSIN
jgi:hypothetical protein